LDKRSKIGIFDSGLGGISVLHDIYSIMPSESFLYFGDSQNAPYGVRSKEEVLELSERICNWMIHEEDVKAIVIACNTATSAAVDVLRSKFNIPIIGMEPAIKPAIAGTTNAVVVLATEMTLKEEKFNHLLQTFEEAHRIIKMPAPLLVDVVENHMEEDDKIEELVSFYLDQIQGKIEGIVLGCTHFIFLRPFIDAYYNGEVELFDGNIGTAYQLKNVLNTLELLTDYEGKGQLKIVNSKGDAYEEKANKMLDFLRKRAENG